MLSLKDLTRTPMRVAGILIATVAASFSGAQHALAAEADSGSAGATAEPVDIPMSSRSRFGNEFDRERFARQFQGVWVEYFGAPATRNVWHVQGDQLELYDRNLETGEIEQKTLKVELFAPCEVRLVQESMQGSSSGQSLKVAMGKKQSYASTAVAVETDEGVFACTGLEYYELDESGCTEWKWNRRDKAWDSSSAQCQRGDGELEVGDTKLKRVGDIYTENPEKRYRLKKVDSIDKARSMLKQD